MMQFGVPGQGSKGCLSVSDDNSLCSEPVKIESINIATVCIIRFDERTLLNQEEFP